MAVPEKVAIENVNKPGRTVSVDLVKYEAVRYAILASLPTTAPGLTLKELKAKILPLLPDSLFPGGAKAGWWLMGVQLDLRAKGAITAEETKPLRFHRV